MFVDGKLWATALLFRTEEQPAKVDVLYLKTSQPSRMRHILLIDHSNGSVSRPNASLNDYRLIFDRILVQSSSGYLGVEFNGVKTRLILSKVGSRDDGTFSFQFTEEPLQFVLARGSTPKHETIDSNQRS